MWGVTPPGPSRPRITASLSSWWLALHPHKQSQHRRKIHSPLIILVSMLRCKCRHGESLQRWHNRMQERGNSQEMLTSSRRGSAHSSHQSLHTTPIQGTVSTICKSLTFSFSWPSVMATRLTHGLKQGVSPGGRPKVGGSLYFLQHSITLFVDICAPQTIL